MNCRDLELELNAYLDHELIGEARADIESHLALCPGCFRTANIERHNLNAVRQAARAAAVTAPAELKEKIFASLQQDERRRRAALARRVGSVAAAVLISATLAHQLYLGHRRRLFEVDAVMRHARHFPLEIEQSPEDIERWFGGKVDYPVAVPRFPNARMEGARLLQVRDKAAAYIRYQAPRPIGLFVYGDDHEVDVGQEPAVGTSQGYNVVSWREGDVVYQLVSDLDPPHLRALLEAPRFRTHESRPSMNPTLEVRPASFEPSSVRFVDPPPGPN
jgi:anti-sigma factor (TIGR02949 family)